MLTAESGPAYPARPAPDTSPDEDWSLDLSGQWRCVLDPDARGELEQWFRSDLPGEPLSVALPGSVQHQGVGEPVRVGTPWTGGVVDRSYFTEDRYAPYREPDNIAVPFWLQPRVYYRGAAWFQREVEIPEGWAQRDVVLSLERVHWESTVWLDEHRAGSERSLTTAHRFDLGRLSPGRHLLTIRVDNRTVVDVGPNAHSVSDHTQGNWNGIVGALSLTAMPAVTISRVRVVPDVATRSARVKVDIAAGTAGTGVGAVRVSARRFNVPGTHEVEPVTAGFEAEYGRDLGERGLTSAGAHVDLEYPLGDDAMTWDEFQPALYELTVELVTDVRGHEHRHAVRTVFGLREVGVDGTQVTINGRRTFIRGTLESCVFPLTGYPPTDVGSWRRIISVCQAHGLNLLRFHSWCPPEAAFVAADEAGFYLQAEGPIWANQGAALGESGPVDAFLFEETRRILHAYGNHPSFIMMAHGNEPGGRDAELLATWVNTWRTYDPRRLYTSGAGWPALSENDYDNIPDPRAHRWGEGLDSRLNGRPPETESDYREWVESRPRPIVSHEIGQWCAYPDFTEMPKYTGLMEPRNFGIFADFLDEAGMADQADAFLYASGRLQALCYKEEIEAALRTEGFGGFHLLGLSDFPGQGTALVGVLNPFWESKGYITPERFARFCGPTVPLARLPRRVWRADQEIRFEVQVAHFGPTPLDAEVRWSIRDSDGADLQSGTVARHAPIPVGNGTRFGPVRVPAGHSTEPAQLTLVVTVDDGAGARYENDWDLWVYPVGLAEDGAGEVAPWDAVLVTTEIEEAIERATAGETVLLELGPEDVGNDVALGFTTVFWNTAWTQGQAPHTLGVLHDPQHPAFRHFPTEGFTDWQWWELLHGARAMLLDRLPARLRPLVQPIDTWFEARRLGALFEARIGRGRLMVSSLNLDPGEDRLAARQFRRSLLSYLASADFSPAESVEPAELRSVLR
ncbi:glycosyl hydrolase family 2 [Promicromonospora sp. AC04]|uniref:sugar-binding domain-containing protein n=1 Tax=Promicromonospora sp. AC04 TaxID=2135723 RepID=UPI000D3A8DAC|nr:sugar-binding domain-containing protein [Promicromonospora sp. AC04]PUB31628.1 glycosyl hydrolase family 2 [Promicromonospora sp. AC04]